MKRLFVLLVFCLTAVPAIAATPVILVFGDSISAGYGLPRVEQGWVALLQARLKDQGYGYQVVNASVSGETTEGGLARLPRALKLHHPAIVVLELGGNDGLRALPVAQMRANLARMAELARGRRGASCAAGHADASQLRPAIRRTVQPRRMPTWRATRSCPWCRLCWPASPCRPNSCKPTAFTPTKPVNRDCSTMCGRF